MKKFYLLALTFVLVCGLGLGTGTALAVKVQQAVCIDGSGSISSANFTLLKEGLAKAVETVIPKDGSVELTVIQFGYPGPLLVKVEVGPTVITGLTYAGVAADIRAMPKGDWGTPMAEAIVLATAEITGSPNFPADEREVINISTNGYPGNPAAVIAARDAAVAAPNNIDLICAEAVPGANVAFLLDLVWPQPGVEIPPAGYPTPPGSKGFVRKVASYAEYGEAIEEKIRFIVEVPTLLQWGLLILILLIAGTGVLIMPRRKKVTLS